MNTSAQNYFLELRNKGIRAAIFEGNWGHIVEKGNFVFELGERLGLIEAERQKKSICGFKTYEGEEFFYEILKTHEFAQNMGVPHTNITSQNENKLEVIVPDDMAYAQKIAEIKELIAAGETYQVNYSIPFEISAVGKDPFEIYCALTRINPSPYMCYIETEDGALISNSPECLFELSADGFIKTLPIKGTMKRGENPQEDAQNEAALSASEKNKAELAMIVDLERNDLGKVCKPGTVRVQRSESGDFRIIEKYSHVIHTVARVEGSLRNDKSWRDALDALFPGGSVTGCPKIRTMEIIKKLENGSRGIYCGSAGFILHKAENSVEKSRELASDKAQTAIFSILIRSLWFDKKTQKIAFRSGGGIVADSVASEEYNELINKAAAIESVLKSRTN